MKKTFIIFISLLLFSCVNKGIIDPNEASEMALNMRIMTKELEIAKYKIENDETFDNISFDFNKIHNQKATDSTFYTESLKPMSESFHRTVENFNNFPNSENYNNIVTSCVQCHNYICSGPLVKINKLYLN